MDRIINKLKEKPLSSNDIYELLDGETSLVKNSDLHKYNNIDDLLYPHNCFFILYETEKNYGHWCCVILRDNYELEFFDPYGYFIDKQLDFIDDDFKKESNQDYPYLSNLFLKSPYKLTYNDVKLQKKENDNSSCGRHIALRMICKELPLKEYQKLMKNTKGMTSDDIATYLTAFI